MSFQNIRRVRASQTIIAVYAHPGQVGDVLDDVREPDGSVVLLVKFPDAPEATSCELGDTVEPYLSVASAETAAPEAAIAEPARTPPGRSRRAIGVAAALAAALLALACWWPSRTLQEADAPSLTPVHLTSAQQLPEREEEIPKDWMRSPCPRDPSIRTHAGACYVVLAGKPPCSIGAELKGECVLPVYKGQRFPSSIAADQ